MTFYAEAMMRFGQNCIAYRLVSEMAFLGSLALRI